MEEARDIGIGIIWKCIDPLSLTMFNVDPENDGSQKESPFPGPDFPVKC